MNHNYYTLDSVQENRDGDTRLCIIREGDFTRPVFVFFSDGIQESRRIVARMNKIRNEHGCWLLSDSQLCSNVRNENPWAVNLSLAARLEARRLEKEVANWGPVTEALARIRAGELAFDDYGPFTDDPRGQDDFDDLAHLRTKGAWVSGGLEDIHLWNGFSSVWVTGGLSRRQVIAKALQHTRKGRKEATHNLASKLGNNQFQYEFVVLEDDEHITIRAVHSYDYYGWREQTEYYTTRNVAVVRVECDEYEDWALVGGNREG